MIRLIAAIDNKRGIAKDHRIPWKLPSDEARFTKLTQMYGANALMGRGTYEAMNIFFKSHKSYVVSHSNLELKQPNCVLVHDIDDFIASFKEDLWVIGGQPIFESTLKYADELYMTLIESDFRCDRFFPDYSDFKPGDIEGPFTENGLTFSYQLFTRF